MGSVKTWLFMAKERDAIVLTRSPFRRSAHIKVAKLSAGEGLTEWNYTEIKDEEHKKRLSEKFEFDYLYVME
jgi:hypothetical protein